MKYLIGSFFVLFVIIPHAIFAGSSLFGLRSQALGEYQYPFSTAAMGRGGVTLAFADSVGINHFNFALWNTLTRSSISLDLRYQNLSSETNTDNIHSANANFQGGFLVLPLQARKLAIGFGLVPYSQNDISVRITQNGQGTNPVQTIRVSGTVSQAHFGLAYRIAENLSLGLSANYTFGLITDLYDLDYNESGYGDITIENKYQVYGVGFGLHAFYDISPRLATGLTLKLPTSLTLFSEQNSLNTVKTIEENREMKIPMHLGVGLGYALSPRWKSGIDFHYQSWEEGYQIENKAVPEMSDSYRIAIGAEREAESRRFSKYADYISWRFGFFMGQLNTKADGESVDEFGFGAGIGLPIIKNRNRFDIAFEIGKRGALDVNSRSEVYFRINFALSTNELWFVREER